MASFVMLCPTVPEKYDSYPQAYEKAAKKACETVMLAGKFSVSMTELTPDERKK
ncbi:hypothetical protein QBS70_11240 [Cronobacter sakazakii]|nr:hypothetical protein [Cronobacter sakazakii]